MNEGRTMAEQRCWCACGYCLGNKGCDCEQCDFHPRSTDARHRRALASLMDSCASQARYGSSTPMWSRVAHKLGMGSTSATVICREFGFNHETGEPLPLPIGDDWREIRGMFRYASAED